MQGGRRVGSGGRGQKVAAEGGRHQRAGKVGPGKVKRARGRGPAAGERPVSMGVLPGERWTPVDSGGLRWIPMDSGGLRWTITLVNLFFDITLTPLLRLVTLVNFLLHHPHPLNAGFVVTPCG